MVLFLRVKEIIHVTIIVFRMLTEYANGFLKSFLPAVSLRKDFVARVLGAILENNNS